MIDSDTDPDIKDAAIQSKNNNATTCTIIVCKSFKIWWYSKNSAAKILQTSKTSFNDTNPHIYIATLRALA